LNAIGPRDLHQLLEILLPFGGAQRVDQRARQIREL
jgi:hypothetical protein